LCLNVLYLFCVFYFFRGYIEQYPKYEKKYEYKREVHIGIETACTVTDHTVDRAHVFVTADHLAYQIGKDMGQTVKDPNEEGKNDKPLPEEMHEISHLGPP
jgi:predicted alpha-1,6-mannanase (GH76 family)